MALPVLAYRASPPISHDELRSRIERGERISRDDALVLWNEFPLAALGELAHGRRQKILPTNTVSFLIDRNINYTNVCNTDCSFCAFYRRDPKHAESYVNSREVIAQKIEEAQELGATRILFQGGHNDDLPYSYYIDTIRWIHETFPRIEINSFSPSEILQMRKISGKSYREILGELKAAGMAGLPGGGAEILDDEVRRRVSPKKIKADEWIEVMEVAQDISLTTTSTMVIGFGETIENRLNHLDRLRNLQDRSRAKGKRGFTSFISWTLQLNENTSMGRSRKLGEYLAGSVEYLRNVALCRIYLDNIVNHQASWPTLGPDVAMVALSFGCNDMGSTMMEENVVSGAGALTKSRWGLSPDELRGYITEAGFRPVQRNSSFEIIG